ncbi:hypothetical protein ACHAXH_008078 [Discostella pseudostelligera]
MGGGLAFLTKKSFNPANWSNQKQVWEARQKDDIEKRRLAERESQLRREREEEDLARVVGGEEAHGRKALSFMYEAGKVPGLDRKVDNGAAAAGAGSGGGDADDFGGGSGGHGTTIDANGNAPSLFERQPGDDDAAAAFREMLARGSMVAGDRPTQPSQSDINANSNNNEDDAKNGKDEEIVNEARDRDLRTNLEKAVGRGITSGSGVTLAQQMERFPMLKGAPRVLPKSSGGGGGDDGKESSENDVIGLNFKPLGQVLRNVKCLKCGQWGHSMGDRECGVSGWNPFAAVPSRTTTMATSSAPQPVASAAAAAAPTSASIVATGTRNDTTNETHDVLPKKRGHERDKDGRSRHKRRKSSSRRHDRSPSDSSFSDSSSSLRRDNRRYRHHHRRDEYSDDESSSYDRRNHHRRSRKEQGRSDNGHQSSSRRRGKTHSSSRRHKHRDRHPSSRSRSRSPSMSE